MEEQIKILVLLGDGGSKIVDVFEDSTSCLSCCEIDEDKCNHNCCKIKKTMEKEIYSNEECEYCEGTGNVNFSSTACYCCCTYCNGSGKKIYELRYVPKYPLNKE